jgi:hypothetical protein
LKDLIVSETINEPIDFCFVVRKSDRVTATPENSSGSLTSAVNRYAIDER